MTSSTDSTRETWTAAIRYITGRKSAEEALGLLVHFSALLDTYVEPAAWGAAAARVCVPYLGSAVSLEVSGVDAPVTVPDEGYSKALAALRAASAANDGTAFVVSDHEKLAGNVQLRPDGVSRELVGSAVVIPLRFRNRSSGRLVLLRGPRHPKGDIGPADLALVSELAARVAVGNALAEALGGAHHEAPSDTTG